MASYLTKKDGKAYLKTWKTDLKNQYDSSTSSTPVQLEDFEWGTFEQKNSIYPSKKFYTEINKLGKKGFNSNGGYLELSSAAINDGFEVGKLSSSFFKKFEIDRQYSGDISDLISVIANDKKILKKLKWDSLPFESMTDAQASEIDWGLITFKKGDLSELDLSKIDWDEVTKKGVKAFEKSFSKLDSATKSELLEGLDDDTLEEMGGAISYEILFDKKDSKKLDKKILSLEIDGDDFELLGQAVSGASANAYAKMQGYEIADMSTYGNEISSITSKIVDLADDYQVLASDGKFSTPDALKLYEDNTQNINDLANQIGLDLSNVGAILGSVENIIDTISAFNLESTELNGSYMVWVEDSSQSLSLLNLNTQEEVEPGENAGDHFVLYKV